MLHADYLRAPIDPIGAMIIMGIDYRGYRQLTDIGFLDRSPGVAQYIITAMEFHTFWDIVQCEARIRLNNYNRIEETYVIQVIDEIALDLENLESENWGDFLSKKLSALPDAALLKNLPSGAIEATLCVYRVVQSVAKKFIEYLGMIQRRFIENN